GDRLLARLLCVFCFQAEDGIRDFHVTGVQTCALPISMMRFRSISGSQAAFDHASQGGSCIIQLHRTTLAGRFHQSSSWTPFACEIGRASCRERLSQSGYGGTLKAAKCETSQPPATARI